MKTKLFLSLLLLLGIISSKNYAQGCGSIFTDPSGANASYQSNTNYTITICPNNPGESVTVTFSSFSTEASFDGLYVYNGNSIASPQIASSNPIGYGGLTTAGAFWGNTIPGPFTSTSPDGCLTFRFVSDGTGNYPGWVADINCGAAPSCSKPVELLSTNTTSTSVTLVWADTASATSWEVLAIPLGAPTPNSSVSGQVVTSNPATISGLTSATNYSFYVRAICALGDFSYWSTVYNKATMVSNDECDNAIVVVPANGHNCTQPVSGSLTGATASADMVSPCTGNANDDVWFQFVANNDILNLSLLNVVGTSPGTTLNFAIYSGTCGALVPFDCSNLNSSTKSLTNLTVGSTYYIRVYSNGNGSPNITFNVCLSIPSTCSNSESICGVNNYSNTTGVGSLGTIGCLSTTPNPTFFTLKIAESGPVNLLITQSTIGSTGANLDVDYAAWGPFTDQAAGCSFVGNSSPFPAPIIDGNAATQLTGCSYSASPTENLNLANAQAGQYYIILITNFSNQAGIINVSQTNVNDAGAGSIDCSGIRLNAFIDYNANGTQDTGEPNSPLGQFHYEINNNGNEHVITSSTGSYIIYNQNLSDLYHLSYTVNADYSSLYTMPSSFSNVSVSAGAMTTYNFPLTSSQTYSDLGVTIVPLNSPRAGTSYMVKVLYTNNGTQTIPSSTLTFNNAIGTSITNVSQTGTTANTNGFTYAITNLLPFESRSMIVTISVPSLPAVYLGQLLDNTASIVPPFGDVVLSNDSNTISQAVIGAYDPNDKIETHGEEILFSEFTTNDYLEYTIRFENNGTAGALNITVNDLLDNQLDENTLVMLAASHSYSLDRLGNNLIWNFNNIQLPVSIPDTNIGKGFIKFKIKPKPDYAVGDIIPNTASIYFDTNPAIVTNTFNTKFVSTLSNELFTEDSITLYPNPARNTVYINLQNTSEMIESIRVYDILGKTIALTSHLSTNQTTLDTSSFAKGVYMVEISSENHLKQIKKLVIE